MHWFFYSHSLFSANLGIDSFSLDRKVVDLRDFSYFLTLVLLHRVPPALPLLHRPGCVRGVCIFICF